MRRTTTLLAAAALALLGLAPASAPAADPVYANHAAPPPFDTARAGEPSIGVDPATGNALFQAVQKTLHVDFSTIPPTWTDRTPQFSSPRSLDPILFTDLTTKRTFVDQLAGACSVLAYTDDFGKSYSPSQGCGIGTAYDHQTVGGGPFPAGVTPLPGSTYPHAVYYCAQADVTASCALSRDGGRTFGNAVPMYTQQDCVGLHGHIKVGPDGAAYVPNFDCRGKQAAVTSRNGGQSWAIDKIPDSSTQDESDPHLGIGAQGTLYFGYANEADPKKPGERSHAMIAVKPRGQGAWRPSIDVGKQLGIENVQFPEVFAGDDDRAAFAFLGTPKVGNDQLTAFDGVWHLYVATTRDGGLTWKTIDATPNDPVQRGCISLGGFGSDSCSHRNLLDFNDITMDGRGRVLVAYADGCVDACVTSTDPAKNTYDDRATIARQESGTGLLATFDGTIPGGSAGVGTMAPGTGASTGTAPARTSACIARSRLGRLRVVPRGRGATFSFAGAGGPVGIDVFQQSRGRRVVGERLVARFAPGTRPVRWNGRANRAGRKVRDGYLFVRFRTGGIARRIAVRRIRGRLRLAPTFDRLEGCGALTAFKLERPVFGGSTRRSLGVTFVLARPGTATLTARGRRGRTVTLVRSSRRAAGRRVRVRLRAGAVPRGDARVTLTVRTATGTTRRTLVARRL